MTVIVDHDPKNAEALASAVGPGTLMLGAMDQLYRHLDEYPAEDVVVLASSIDSAVAFHFTELVRVSNPALGVILVRRRLDTSLYAEAMRAGVREVVTDRDLAGLGQAVRRARDLARQIRRQVDAGHTPEDSRPRGHVITVFSAKGGCGKTTFATNLGVALADHGRREVCIFDIDLAFGDVAIVLQLFPAHTIADALPLADSLDEHGVAALLTPHSPGLTTLVAPVEPGTGEHIPSSLVADLISLLRGMFDFVIIDTPVGFTDPVLAAFDASELIALMATLDIPALKNLKLTLETLELLNYPREKWRVVLNRADSKVGLALSEVEKTLRVPISAHIPSSREVPAAVNRGVPLMQDSPNHPVSAAVRQFVEQHLANLDADAGGRSRRVHRGGGFLRRRATTP
jgi:pilus assembly protein CpaE